MEEKKEKKSDFYKSEIKHLTEDRDWCYRNLQSMWKRILENVDEEIINEHFEVIMPEWRLIFKKDIQPL